MSTNSITKDLFARFLEKELRLAGLNEQHSESLSLKILRSSSTFLFQNENDSESSRNNTEEEWLSKVTEVIADSLSAPDFSVELIAEKMGLSSRQLRRNIKKVSGYPPSELIKKIRLDKAKILLDNSEITFQELAREVGITKKSYFVHLFYSEFGYRPQFKILKTNSLSKSP